MSIIRRTLFICLALATSCANAVCSFKTSVFEGTLNVVEADAYGFPTMLATPEDALSEVVFDCDEETTATLRVFPPERLDNRVPPLKTKPRSFFVYKGERYGVGEERESVLVTGGLEDEAVGVGIVVGNGEDVLLASDDYRYTVIVQLTIEEEPGEEEAESGFGESTVRTLETIIGQEP